MDNYPRPCYLNSYENFSRLGSELEGGRGPEDNMLMRQRGSGLYLMNGVHEGHGERIDICSMYPASRTCARLPEAHESLSTFSTTRSALSGGLVLHHSDNGRTTGPLLLPEEGETVNESMEWKESERGGKLCPSL